MIGESSKRYFGEAFSDYMPKILFIRHGESQSNIGLATLRPEDVELTNKGWKQAEAIAKFLRQSQFSPNLIVTSSYLRTKQTSAPTTLMFPSVLEEEWPVHEFTYLSSWLEKIATIDDRRPFVHAYWENSDPEYNDGPGAESFEQFMGRVRMMRERLESIKRGTIAVFSHEQFISAFLWLTAHNQTRPTPEEMSEFREHLLAHPIPNGAIVEAKFHQKYGWNFRMIISHLNAIEESSVSGLESAVKEKLELALPER